MEPVVVVGGARVFHGDCREVLKNLPDNSVDSIVTDPPYELNFMSKSWDNSGIAYDLAVWAECLRVLKPGGHVLAFGGSRTWHRLAVAVEDAGFEIRDNIAWIYGSGFPKSLDVSKAIDKRAGAEREVVGDYQIGGMSPDRENFGANDRTGGKGMGFRPGTVKITEPSSSEAKAWEGWGTALKPAHEPIVVGRKPFGKGVTVAENVLTWGVGGLNIDKSRVEAVDQIELEKNWDRFQSVSALEGRNAMNGGLGTIDLSDRKAQGRWPANVIFDEVTAGLLDEQSGVSVSPRKASSGGAVFGSRTYAQDDYSQNMIRGEMPAYGDTGGASRFFYVAKASKRDRNEGLEELEAVVRNDGRNESLASGDMPQNRSNNPKQNFHPTVKPTALMRYLIKLVTPPGGTVLDPFTGSGSTGKAALLDGFQFVGVELTEEYLPIIEGRLRWASEQGENDGTLF